MFKVIIDAMGREKQGEGRFPGGVSRSSPDVSLSGKNWFLFRHRVYMIIIFDRLPREPAGWLHCLGPWLKRRFPGLEGEVVQMNVRFMAGTVSVRGYGM